MTKNHRAHLSFVAGESSGDLLGAHLLAHIKKKLPTAFFDGIGGSRMQAEGLISHGAMETLSVHGIVDALRHYPKIRRLHYHLLQQLLAQKPAVFVGIDAPDFNFPLEKKLHNAQIPIVHFIGPSVWAWRAWRLKKIRNIGAHMLVLFPFETAIYEAANIPVSYVGHPLAQTIPMAPNMAQARRDLNLSSTHPVIALLPGSRVSELVHHVHAFAMAANILHKRHPDCQFVCPLAQPAHLALVKKILAQANLKHLPLHFLTGSSFSALAAADVVLVASGTASLEAALHKKPMVIAYHLAWPNYWLGRMLVKLPWIGLPNILAKTSLVPEFIQAEMTAENLANALWKQLHDEAGKDHLRARFTALHHDLQRDTADLCAQVILEKMQLDAP